jgi:hypothetical protein
LALTFFGLTPEHKEYFLEAAFNLMYYMGFTYNEAMSLPIWQRTWFLERMQKEMSGSKGQTRAAHGNDQGTRTLMGMHRSNPPAKLRRFT